MIYLISIIGAFIFGIVLLIKIKRILPLFLLVVSAFVFVSAGYLIKYHLSIINFHSFNLDELKRQELVIQTISFKKFKVQGTEVPLETATSKFTDEVSVYFVEGKAEISFTDIDNLKMNEEASDVSKKILKLDYNNQKAQIPFSINILIGEKDIYKVASMESVPLEVGVLKTDLIKPEMSQAQIVENVKNELQKEFESQIIDSINAKKLEDSDIYQAFLLRLTEIITGLSDWESVEINFMN